MNNLLVGYLGLFGLAMATSAPAQEITLRAGTKEVVVPFVVFDQKGFAQGCPSQEALTVRENGREMQTRSVQMGSSERIAIGLVVSLDNEMSFTAQEDTRVAARLAHELLDDGDGCVAVNATGFPDWWSTGRKYPDARQSDFKAGRAGCLPFLDDLSVRLERWRDQGDVTGFVGFTWEGVSLALRALIPDWRPRRAIIVFGKGIDRDHETLPLKLKREVAAGRTSIYSLYLQPEDPLDPRVQAKWKRFARTPQPIPMNSFRQRRVRLGLRGLRELTLLSGGEFHEVTEETIFPIAKGIIASLRQQCQLTYEPPADGAPGYRKIEVTISTPGWKVRHRPGYYPDQVGQSSKP